MCRSIFVQCPAAKRVGGNAGQPLAPRKPVRSWGYQNDPFLPLEKIGGLRGGRWGVVDRDLFGRGEEFGLRGRFHSQPAEQV